MGLGGRSPPSIASGWLKEHGSNILEPKLDPKLIKMEVKKSIKNRSKIHQKSIKNRPKIDQKSTKNRSKIDQHRGLEGVWEDSGNQARLERRLGVSWRPFGASWRPLGPSWLEKVGPHGSNLAPKTEPKSIKIRS